MHLSVCLFTLPAHRVLDSFSTVMSGLLALYSMPTVGELLLIFTVGQMKCSKPTGQDESVNQIIGLTKNRRHIVFWKICQPARVNEPPTVVYICMPDINKNIFFASALCTTSLCQVKP